ncbi:MAG: hypothetical protein ACK48S_09730 [Planctomycetia bacterium]
MRIRTIKPEFFNHEGIYDAELQSNLPLRLAFIGLWCAADREGRFKWEPRRLGVQILPYDNVDFSRVLDALMTRGFIVKYENEKGVYGFVPTFDKHQVINNRERESELPNPCDCNVFDACLTREPRDDDAGKAEGKGREGNMEGKGTRNKRVDDALPLPFDSADFKLFWENWEQHRKEKKAKLTPTARNQQLEKLKDMGEHRAVAALKHSLANGWTGIFEPERAKPNGQHKGIEENIPLRRL